MIPIIFGLSGPILTSAERDFFYDVTPAGYIIFRRNIENRAQLQRLTDDLRSIHASAPLPILIDQEGGRVARMASPQWPNFPTGETFDKFYDHAPASAIQAARLNGRALAAMLGDVGVTVNCLPLLDLRRPDTSDIIGDRALGSEPQRIAALGRALLRGMAAGGVVGVIKHIPGHGRATQDTHLSPAIVEASDSALEQDLRPFIALKDAAMAMTCHVIFRAWDATQSATTSPFVIETIIRQRIGFAGLLISDDIEMKALGGDRATRAVQAIAAGCDVALHCSGVLADMVAIAAAVPKISDQSRARLNVAMTSVLPDSILGERTTDALTLNALLAERDALLSL